jgi:hypothetical protein
MKTVLLIIAALLSAALGIYIIVVTKATSTPALIVGATFVAFALMCMAPVQIRELREQLIGAWTGFRNAPPNDGGLA